ncbi:Lsr2 family protein [Microbacterium invictum]
MLEVGEGETVLFSLDGTAYEIDLTDENASALRAALAPFTAAGRSVSARAAQASSGRRVQKRSGQRDYGPIRKWAAENGYTVSERGRVPASVLEAYDAAH